MTYIIVVLLFSIGIIWMLNKEFGSSYSLDVYNQVKKFIHSSFEEKNLANMSLIILWTASGITILLVLYTLGLTPSQGQMNPLQLLSAFAILLSALMASVSVLLNIKKTRELKILELQKIMFEDIASFITDISISGNKPSLEDISDLAKKTRTAKYFFNDDIDIYINNIIDKSSVDFDYQWFQDQRVSEMDEKFKPYFNF